jgi:hypothetical protein
MTPKVMILGRCFCDICSAHGKLVNVFAHLVPEVPSLPRGIGKPPVISPSDLSCPVPDAVTSPASVYQRLV